MTNKVRDLLCSVIMIAFGVFMFVEALGIPHKIKSDVGSGYVPKFLAICIVVVGIAKLVITLTRKDPNDNKKPVNDNDTIGGLVTIALMVVYMLIFQPVGFVCSSAMYLFAQIMWFSNKQNRNPILFAAIAVLIPLAIDALFVFVIKMPLPKGVFGF